MAGPNVVVSVLADTAKFKRGMDGLGRTGSKFGNLMKGVGVAAGAAFAAGATALAAFGVGAVRAASNLEQSIGGVQSVFQGFAGQIEGFAKGAAQNLGLTQNAFNEVATIIGTTLKNAGTPMEALAGQTNTLVTRAADLAATFGGDVAEATNAVGSALRGEFEPLRRYGVSLSVADINARAMADSGKASADALTKQEKALATQALIMEQSADAAGAFARESNTLAGQQARLTAVWGNLSATIGTAFLPAITAGATALNNFLQGISESTAFQTILTQISGFVEGLFNGSAAASTFGQVFQAVSAFLNPFGLVIQALIPVLPTLTTAFQGLAATLGGVFMTILPTITSLIQTVVQALSGVLAGVLPVVIGLITQLAGVFANLVPVLVPIVEIVAGVLASTFERLVPIITILAETLGGILGAVITALAPILALAAELLGTILTAAMPIIDAVLGLVEAFAPLIAVIGELIGAILPPLIGLIMALLEPILSLIGPILSGLAPAIQFLAGVLGAIIGVVTAVIRTFVGLITGSKDTQRGVSQVWNAIMNFFGQIPKRIGAFFAGAVNWLRDAGRNIIEGLKRGIESAVDGVMSFISDVGSNIANAFQNVLGIRSPSRVFMGFGRNIIEGLAGGLSQTSQVGAAMRNVSRAVTNGFDPAPFPVGAGLGRGGNYYEVHVDGGLATGAEIGRAIVDALDEFERLNGRRGA